MLSKSIDTLTDGNLGGVAVVLHFRVSLQFGLGTGVSRLSEKDKQVEKLKQPSLHALTLQGCICRHLTGI